MRILVPRHLKVICTMKHLHNKRVGLFGCAGSGKTTFGKWLVHRTGATIRHEGVREWMQAKGIRRFSEISEAKYVELQKHLLRDMEKSDAQIFDRTPVDVIAHLRAMSNRKWFEQEYQFAKSTSEKIDLFLFFPFYSLFLEDDGYRIMDAAYQIEMGTSMISVLTDFGLRDRILVFEHHRPYEENLVILDSILGRLE